MKIFIFDNKTKEYLYTQDAFMEPLTETFVNQANGTFIPPHAAIPRGYVQIFNNSYERWDIVPDYRGQEVFNITTHKFEKIYQFGELQDEQLIVDPETRIQYSQNPNYFDITTDGLVKKSKTEIEKIDQERLKLQKRKQRALLFQDIDWRIWRAMDSSDLQIPCPEERTKLIQYRQYLRDFTNQDDWWNDQCHIKSIDEFMKTETEKYE